MGVFMKYLYRLFFLILIFLNNNAYAVNDLKIETLTAGLLSTIIYGGLGIIMAVVAFKVVDKITPGNLSFEITEGKNTGLAIFAGLTVLGICIIIAAVIA
jgi:uncharacterized membrane protein YjfL (UPF0719 family)